MAVFKAEENKNAIIQLLTYLRHVNRKYVIDQSFGIYSC